MKKSAFLLVLFIFLHFIGKQGVLAQSIPFEWTTTQGAGILYMDVNGVFAAAGSLGSGNLSAVGGAGTRMVWYPGKGAFRAGTLDSTGKYFWNDDSSAGFNVGLNSVAFGFDTAANGQQSAAFGNNALASGNYSLAAGQNTTASGGWGLAFGQSTTASSSWTVALGAYTTASNLAAMALGYQTTASGMATISAGYETTAPAFGEVVIGQYNLGQNEGGSAMAVNAASWVVSDPVFEIGNGSASGNTSVPSDAFEVYKNGDVVAQGTVAARLMRCQAGGDISMGTFTAIPTGGSLP